MTSIFKNFGPWLARLAFWRKPKAENDAVEDETAAADEPDVAPQTEPAQRDAPDTTDDTAAIEAPKQRFFARVLAMLRRRRKPLEVASEDEAQTDETAPTEATDEAPTPKVNFAARLKLLLSFRRKSNDVVDADKLDKTQVIEKPDAAAADSEQEGDAEATPPSRLKQFIARLRNKWVWIPALSFVVVGLISWLVVIMLLATNEKERLQAELKTAKKMLEQNKPAAEKPLAPVPLPPPAAPPEKPAPKIDPAFQIVGHVPAPKSEESVGVDAADCLIKDKESVAANLKNCITSFNEAVASTSKKTKKP